MVQVNWVAAVLPLLAESVNVPAPTSMVVAPGALGVNVAVYTVPDPEKPLILPPDTVASPSAKSVVPSLAVKVSVRVASSVDEPLVTVVPPLFFAAIVMVGGVVSGGLMTSALFAPREPEAPGLGSVNVAALDAPSMIEAPNSVASAEVDV